MIVYTVILLMVSSLFFIIGLSIYRGRTDLIHDYHQKNVKDKAAYGKAMGKALLLMALAMTLSGIAAQFVTGFFPVAFLVFGLSAGIVQLVRAQKKFNSGVF